MSSETELVERAKNRDAKAFEELMLQNQGKIYNLGLKLLGNKEDAADLLQETFIKAYESISGFEGRSAFSTWLYRIATNFALMKFRKNKKKKVSLDEIKEISKNLYREQIMDWSENPHAHLKNIELRKILENSIASLPSKYKTVFVLHDIEGFSMAKVGEILSLSIPAVKSRIHRSRLFLREKLAKYFQASEN